MSIRLLIADDDPLIRESLKIIIGLDADFQVLDCVENGLAATEYCQEHTVDVALLDIRMPILNGVQATKKITKETNTKCLILTTFDEDEYIKDAMRFGAKGYLLKNNSPDKIKDAIRAVNSGHTVLQDVIMEKVMNGLDTSKTEAGNEEHFDKSLFTEREVEIIEAVAEGLSNKEIAGKLYISEGTVKNYISVILSKTHLNHRTQIAILYIKSKKWG